MTPPRQVLVAIACAVERHGGDMDDVADLIATWERVQAVTGPRADRMRYEAATRPCRCADGGMAAEEGGRCERCGALIAREAAR
jgi:hypothetical protein